MAQWLVLLVVAKVPGAIPGHIGICQMRHRYMPAIIMDFYFYQYKTIKVPEELTRNSKRELNISKAIKQQIEMHVLNIEQKLAPHPETNDWQHRKKLKKT